jgi:hypothetical protein
MKMPWRSRSRAELLQALHHEVTTARDELRATVVDAVAVAEGRLRKDLDLHEEMQELVTRLDTTCAEYETHDDEMRHMLTRVADAYELLARRIEEERAERRLLVGALEQLAQSMPALGPPQPPIRPPRDRVLGGTVDAARAPQLDLTQEEAAEAATPTRPRRH